MKMEEQELKQYAAVYMMLNEELREGNFLQKRFYDISHPCRSGGHDPIGVISGTQLDIVAQLMAEGKFFSDEPDIANFMRKGQISIYNAKIVPVEPGLKLNVVGEFAIEDGIYVFKPFTISQKEYLNPLRTQEGFVDYARQLKMESDGITIEDGFLRVYGSDQAPKTANGRLVSTPIEAIANRLFVKIAKQEEAQPKSE